MRYSVAFVLLLLIVPLASAERLDRCRGTLARFCEEPTVPDVEVPETPAVPGLTGVPDAEDLSDVEVPDVEEPDVPVTGLPTLDPELPRLLEIPEELPPLPGVDADPCFLFPKTIPTPAALVESALRSLGYSSDELDNAIRALGEPRERCERSLP